MIAAKIQNVVAAPRPSFIDGNVLVTRKTRNQFSITARLDAMALVSAVNNSPINIHGIGPSLKNQMFFISFCTMLMIKLYKFTYLHTTEKLFICNMKNEKYLPAILIENLSKILPQIEIMTRLRFELPFTITRIFTIFCWFYKNCIFQMEECIKRFHA